MFVNISPAVYNMGETVCSLNFAARCRNVELGQAKKQIEDGTASSSSSSMPPPKSQAALASSTSVARRISMGTPSSATKK
jgi:hypothetical protein